MSYLEDVSRVQFHRVTALDFPRVSTFNGKTYKASDGWVPHINGCRFSIVSGVMIATAGAGFGLNWAINATGFWELYGDVVGGSEAWVVDIQFTCHNITNVTRFGTFN